MSESLIPINDWIDLQRLSLASQEKELLRRLRSAKTLIDSAMQDIGDRCFSFADGKLQDAIEKINETLRAIDDAERWSIYEMEKVTAALQEAKD